MLRRSRLGPGDPLSGGTSGVIPELRRKIDASTACLPRPGRRELHPEGFLVTAGECLLVVEGEERSLKAWDLFHCPGGTAHAIVGAGNGPSLVLAFGARGGRKGIEYLPEAAARGHDAAVERATKFAEAYARFPRPTRVRCGEDWLP